MRNRNRSALTPADLGARAAQNDVNDAIEAESRRIADARADDAEFADPAEDGILGAKHDAFRAAAKTTQ